MAVNDTWKGLYGMLLDDLFLAPAQPSPSCQWYTRLLAARDIIFHAWITFPRAHTRTTTLITLTLANLLAILDIRFLSLQGGHKAKWGMKLAKGLAPEWGDLLTRPPNMLHENRFPDAINFINAQVSPITGNTPADTHMVYLMTIGSQPYVGRTAGHRASSSYTLAGVAPRWSEHIRDLHKHHQGELEPSKQRRRYNELLNHHSSSCFNCLILETTNTAGIKAAEAEAITLINPSANGTELKHFSETFRSHKPRPRKDTRQPRSRKFQVCTKKGTRCTLEDQGCPMGRKR